MKPVIDESLPRMLKQVGANEGNKVCDIRDTGSRGAADRKIVEFAHKENAIVVTADRGMGNMLRFPRGSHSGIIVLNYPTDISLAKITFAARRVFKDLLEKDIKGNIIIIEPGKLRIRKERFKSNIDVKIWLRGYDAFLMSPSHLNSDPKYILQQTEHHKNISYEDKFFRIFKKFKIVYN